VTRTAVVTGAAAGIGRAIAHRLATDGDTVVAVDVAPGIEDTAAELHTTGAAVVPVRADLTDPAGRDAVRDAVRDCDPPLGVLVNCAGITRDARLVKMTDDAFTAVLAVNTGAAYQLTRLLVPDMAPGSAVVNISSRAYLGNFGQYNYSMSKGALVGMTRALALDLAPAIRVNAVAPGLIGTEMVMTIPEEIRARMIAAIPAGRMGTPDEIAEVVSWLASPASSYITGTVLIAGGGRSLTR
jgi:3-oxoacyl-[acyl-carrier protein] reductase